MCKLGPLVNAPTSRDEFQKRIEIPAVSGAQSGDIVRAALAVCLQVKTARPNNRRMIVDVFQQDIRGDAGMTTIAVRKQVYLHHAVMKARGGFQRRINVVLSPLPRIAEKAAELRLRAPQRSFECPEIGRHIAHKLASQLFNPSPGLRARQGLLLKGHMGAHTANTRFGFAERL